MSSGSGLIGGIIVALLLLSALAAAVRASLWNASRTRLGELQKRGIRGAGSALRLLADEDRTMGALALAKMLAVALAGGLAAFLLFHQLPPLQASLAAIALIVVFALFGLVLPDAYAARRADRVAVILSGPAQLMVAILGPPAVALEALARGILTLTGSNGADETHTMHEELREAIDLHAKDGTVIKNDRDMLSGILAMQDLEVSDIMVHRTKMTMLDIEEDAKEIVNTVLKSGHTRLPVWKDNPDNIIGVLHAKNLFAALQKHNGDATKVDIEDILLPPWFVPDTRAIPDQLNAFLKRKSHFAIVVDEYGEVQGLVTLEDIIEEIVGDIKDEHDAVATGVRPKPDGSYLVDGGVAIRDLNRAFDWTLPDEEANTIAGLVIHEARMIPAVGQAFVFHCFRFEILKKRHHQITALRMTPVKRESEAAQGAED
ncbi:MAG: CNNM domain-containing protein [Aestuariivirga sp.]|uniref:HlyC/CorC family transporter n=1 Tax=Aestuariivirga sp. TaxID=2650926 RepID=UPI0030173B2B